MTMDGASSVKRMDGRWEFTVVVCLDRVCDRRRGRLWRGISCASRRGTARASRGRGGSVAGGAVDGVEVARCVGWWCVSSHDQPPSRSMVSACARRADRARRRFPPGRRAPGDLREQVAVRAEHDARRLEYRIRDLALEVWYPGDGGDGVRCGDGERRPGAAAPSDNASTTASHLDVWI